VRLPRVDFGPGPAAVDGAVEPWARMTACEPAAARRFEGDPAGLRRRRGQFLPVAAGVVADEERAEVARGVALHLHQREELVAVDQREGDVGRGYAYRVGPQAGVAPGPPAVARHVHGRPHVAFPPRFGERPAAPRACEVDAADLRHLGRGRSDRPPGPAAVRGPEEAAPRAHPAFFAHHHFAFVDIAVGFDPPPGTAPSGGRGSGPSYFENRFFRPGRPGLRRPGRGRAAAAAREEGGDEDHDRHRSSHPHPCLLPVPAPGKRRSGGGD
jgi:hypothetical protein